MEEASHFPEDADRKGPGTELISLQTSRIQNDSLTRRTRSLEEPPKWQLVVVAEGISEVFPRLNSIKISTLWKEVKQFSESLTFAS